MRRQRPDSDVCSAVTLLELPRVAVHDGALLVEAGAHVGRALILAMSLVFVATAGRALHHAGASVVRATSAGAVMVFVGAMGATLMDALVTASPIGSGFSSIGAVLVAPLALAAASHVAGVPIASVADRVTTPGIALLAMSRLGCLADGCDYGRLTELDWGVRYLNHTSLMARLHDAGAVEAGAVVSPLLHPFPAYESAGLLLVLAVAAPFRSRVARAPGVYAMTLAFGWALVRGASECFRGNTTHSIAASLAMCIALVGVSAAALGFFAWRRAPKAA